MSKLSKFLRYVNNSERQYNKEELRKIWNNLDCISFGDDNIVTIITMNDGRIIEVKESIKEVNEKVIRENE